MEIFLFKIVFPNELRLMLLKNQIEYILSPVTVWNE